MSVDRAVSERDKNIHKFCVCLDKDIEVLGKEVKEIKNQAQVGRRDYSDQMTLQMSIVLS